MGRAPADPKKRPRRCKCPDRPGKALTAGRALRPAPQSTHGMARPLTDLYSGTKRCVNHPQKRLEQQTAYRRQHHLPSCAMGCTEGGCRHYCFFSFHFHYVSRHVPGDVLCALAGGGGGANAPQGLLTKKLGDTSDRGPQRLGFHGKFGGLPQYNSLSWSPPDLLTDIPPVISPPPLSMPRNATDAEYTRVLWVLGPVGASELQSKARRTMR